MAVLTEEQSMLRDAAKTWTQEKSPVSAFRKMRDSGAPLGYDPAAFNEMAEMGWTGVIIPEEYGGSDFGYLGLGLILEETGRTLTASPIRVPPRASCNATAARRSAASGSRPRSSCVIRVSRVAKANASTRRLAVTVACMYASSIAA